MARVVRLFLIGAMPILLFLAYGEFEDWEIEQGRKESLQAQLYDLRNEGARLGEAPRKPVLPRNAAVEDLIARLVDDTDLLGGSVRLGIPEGGLTWELVKFGLEKASLSVTTAADDYAALGFFYILWELLEDRPVTISGGTITMENELVTIDVRLDLYAMP